MNSPRMLMCALLAACAAAGNPSPATAESRVPGIVRVEARLSANDLVVTAWYAERGRARTLEYATDHAGGWAAQLYLTGPSGVCLVGGLQCRDGVAPVQVLEMDPEAGIELGRQVGEARLESRPYGLVVRVPLACVGGAAPTGYRLQLYAMKCLGPEYNNTVRAEYVTEYAGALEPAGNGQLARRMGASLEPAAPAPAGTASWGAVKARYR